jgi:hypothetical protein
VRIYLYRKRRYFGGFGTRRGNARKSETAGARRRKRRIIQYFIAKTKQYLKMSNTQMPKVGDIYYKYNGFHKITKIAPKTIWYRYCDIDGTPDYRRAEVRVQIKDLGLNFEYLGEPLNDTHRAKDTFEKQALERAEKAKALCQNITRNAHLKISEEQLAQLENIINSIIQ